MQRDPSARTTIFRWESNFKEKANLAHRAGNVDLLLVKIQLKWCNKCSKVNQERLYDKLKEHLAFHTLRYIAYYDEKLAMFPYKLRRLHAMHEQDYTRRVQFAQYCRVQIRNSSYFLSRIAFFDECLFRVNGSVNTPNVRIWGTESPCSVY